jgi:acetyl esterase/lipase
MCPVPDFAIDWTHRISQISIGGFSAGATLALSVAQTTPKPAAVVAFYPPCDLSAASKTTIWGPPKSRNMTLGSYLLDTAEENLSDPAVSPRYARTADLPDNLMIIIPQLDPNVSDMRDMIQDWKIHGAKNVIDVEYKTPHGWNYILSLDTICSQKSGLQ